MNIGDKPIYPGIIRGKNNAPASYNQASRSGVFKISPGGPPVYVFLFQPQLQFQSF